MRILDINTWKRKQHYEHFSTLVDPYFAVTIPFNVTKAYNFSKENNISFFAKYLHDSMRVINSIENLKYRIEDNNVVEYEVIHASSTIMRKNNTFGFSFIDYNEDLNVFIKNIESEKTRIINSSDLYPPKNGLDCIHCSAMPWLNFSGHKEPVSGKLDSVPKLAFSKASKIGNELIMNVSINVNHALVDGYHLGLFSDKFQQYLNQ
ncbi:chloramphenicol O-acetyltransferase type A [Flaviramulus basaltis]|uniref:Chloramphenicol O-acetyltransferase type A n=1 Tax=Flaviramulus basaltis TaxID=369401 RepID=A0A1K2IGE9_9FLAO|nr:CatA-like O-acetyltransferase [Flaviramulus basaltis]SFZ91497.1 chloramphenicol O-acetyltransferase type A [Flaviramulus basaltis]